MKEKNNGVDWSIFEDWTNEQKLGFRNYLSDFITDNKKTVIEQVLSERSRYFTAVFEDLYKPHNVSASIRTLDCLGVQDVNVIEYANSYTVNPFVLRGAGNWVSIRKFHDRKERATERCFKHLRGL